MKITHIYIYTKKIHMFIHTFQPLIHSRWCERQKDSQTNTTTRTHTHAPTHTHAHTHTHIYTHTHTNTHTQCLTERKQQKDKEKEREYISLTFSPSLFVFFLPFFPPFFSFDPQMRLKKKKDNVQFWLFHPLVFLLFVFFIPFFLPCPQMLLSRALRVSVSDFTWFGVTPPHPTTTMGWLRSVGSIKL